MGYSKRDYTTREERAQLVIDKGTKKSDTNSFNKNKISEYLSQPNVKQFNALLVDKSFSRIDTKRKGRPQLFKSREECKNEVEGYFKLCYDYDMIPTVASLALYLGMGRQNLYDTIRTQTNDFSDILQNAVDTCQAYQETPALEGRLSAPTWIFTAKNYFSMQDNQNINILATNQTQNGYNNLDAIKNQIELENKNQDIIDMK